MRIFAPLMENHFLHGIFGFFNQQSWWFWQCESKAMDHMSHRYPMTQPSCNFMSPIFFGFLIPSANGLIVGLGWWFGFLGSPYERDCYSEVPLKSQTTNQTTHLPLHMIVMSNLRCEPSKHLENGGGWSNDSAYSCRR